MSVHEETIFGYWGSIRVPTIFRYDSTKPYEVMLVYPQKMTVSWVFSRDLLVAAASGAAGQGDVKITCDGHIYRLAFSSEQGTANIEYKVGDVDKFINRTYEVVPAGKELEHFDLDAELKQLME